MPLKWIKVTVILQGFVTLIIHWYNPLRTIRPAFRVLRLSVLLSGKLINWAMVKSSHGFKEFEF